MSRNRPLAPSTINTCPACKADLIYYRDTFRAYSRVIGRVRPEAFGGVLFWACPDCAHTWHRWPVGDRLHAAAEAWVDPEVIHPNE